MAPSPILYTASPIVPDQADTDQVSTKLTVEVADRTLGLIEEVLEVGNSSAQKKVKKTTRKRDSVKEFIKSSSVTVLLLIAFIAVLISGIVDLVTEISAVNACETEIIDRRDACEQFATASVPVPAATSEPAESPSEEGIGTAVQGESEPASSSEGTSAQTDTDTMMPDEDSEAPSTARRRLNDIFLGADEEEEEPASTDHCCVSNPDLSGCSFNEGVGSSDDRIRIGLLEEENTPRRPLFTKNRVVVEDYYREFRVYCRMNRMKQANQIGSPETQANWLGAQKWRWLLFVALYFPLGPISHAIAGIFSFFVTSFSIGGRNAAFLAFGLHVHVTWVIRNALWFGAWFGIMFQPNQWARRAAENNRLAGRTDDEAPIWDDTFKDAFEFGWHLLLAFLLLAVFALVRSAIARVLSLRFHHANHFDQMQKALVQESVVQALSKPNCLPETTVVNSAGRSIVLRSYDNAHWAALKWVSAIVDGSGGSELQDLADIDSEKLTAIKQRAAQVQMRLAEALSTEWLKHAMTGEDMAYAPSGGGADGTPRRPTDMLGSLNENKPASDGVVYVSTGAQAGMATKLTGAQRRSAENQENEAAANGQNQYRPQAEGPWDTTVPLGPGTVPLGTNQSAFNHTTGSMEFNNPLVPQDFIQSATTHIAKPDQNIPEGPRGAAPPFWSPVGTARAQQRWAGLRLRLKKQPSNTTTNPSKRASSSFYSTLQQALEKQKKEHLPGEAAGAADYLAQVHDQRGGADLEPKRGGGLFGRGTKEQDLSTRKAQRLASQLRRASETEFESSNINTTVQTLQAYLLSNSNIQVFSLINADGSIDDGNITDSVAARKLGYYIFWNLRQEDTSGLAVDEAEVKDAALRAGIKHTDTAWELFDRNCDNAATLEEIVSSVETVFDNRDSLLRTLRDNETVVAQVEIAIGILFFIIWMFTTAAIFNGEAVQQTWTALSAGLLSFSFIFGNSIREVFENAVFLFFTHPFDVGDAIRFEGDRFKVMSITLQYVKLIRLDGAAINVPCRVMKDARIHNVSRSNNLWANIKVVVDSSTPTTVLEAVGTAVHATIKANPKWYGGSYRVWWMDALPGAKIELGIFYDYSINGLDLLTVGIARTEMYTAVFEALNTVGVEYTLPPVKNNGSSGPDSSPSVQPSAAVAARRHAGATYAGAQQHEMQQAADDAANERAAVAQHALLLA